MKHEEKSAITIRLKIKALYPELSPTEKRIADYVLDYPEKTSRSTINEIAQFLEIAVSTFFQFTRKLGYSGFKEFKIALLTEESDASVSIHENIQQSDNDYTKIEKVFDSTIQSLQDTKKLIHAEDYGRTADIFLKSNIVSFFGIGGSSVVAEDMYHKFLRSPVQCQYVSDYHMQLMNASLLTSNDCAFIISHTGATKETIEIAKTARKTSAKIIVLTSYPTSPLTKIADIVLTCTAEETAYRSEALASRISQLAIIDAIFVLAMFRNSEQANQSLKTIRTVIADHKL